MLQIPPKYILTPKIVVLLQKIEGCRQVIDAVELPPEIELNIRRQSTLKSSLFSARIEGNTLTMDDLPKASSQNQKKQEVLNTLKAINWIYQRKSRDLSSQGILKIHELAMEGLLDKHDLGRYRTNLEAIFNSAGIAIYLPPRPAVIPSLMNKLITFASTSKEQFIPIKACLCHYSFEKIHPFLDGNGRVGRIILQAVLAKDGYGMRGLLTLEEYLDAHRSDYYQALEAPERDVTDYLEFMLEAIAHTAEEVKKTVLEKKKMEVSDYLLPRRAEILAIINDHKLINFDMIRRRFMSINERTLRYDLKKLVDANLIKKLGTTNGVYYQSLNSQ